MAMFTKNKVLRVPDYFDAVIKTNHHKTPLLSILKRGAKPKDWLQEVECEGATRSYQMAAAEGGVFDRTKLGKRLNLTLKHNLQKFRSIEGWSVTDESEDMPSHTEARGEKSKAREIRKDAEEVVLSVEHAFSSDQEAVERGTADDTVAKTRGLGSWLKPLVLEEGETEAEAAARIHPVQTINPVLMPRAGFTGNVKDLSKFNEDVFWDMIEQMADEQGDDILTLTMLAGGGLKKIMSSFLYKVKTVTGVENAYRLSVPNSKKKSLICDIFENDSALVRVIRDNHLFCSLGEADLKGIQDYVQSDVSKFSGALIRPEFWAVEVFSPLKNVELPKEGDVSCGYHKTIQRLACRNPLAQAAIVYQAPDPETGGK